MDDMTPRQEPSVNEYQGRAESNTTDPINKTKKAGALIHQIGLNMVVVGVIALLAVLAWQRFFVQPGSAAPAPEVASTSAGENGGDPVAFQPVQDVALAPIDTPASSMAEGISRKIDVNTIIPSRPRDNVITYTVSTGDTLFSIAYNYGLKPETLLWGNSDSLDDNPHLLKPNQVLRVLPVDGIYYKWEEGNRLSAIAAEFKVEPDAIINYPGNNFDLTQVDSDGANIQPGTWMIIPGGWRPIKDWGPPAITRDNPATARYYGEGACGAIYSGAIGTGTFIWPTTDHGISGYGYDPSVHPAIDIAGTEGNPVYATDSGVIVYAGWSAYGYGQLIVIDHGNGWQSAYAHLSVVGVSCGQSVYQGGYIGALGNTGNSTGAHLHFELSYNGVKVNPLGYVS
jgi:murein DD-endopeptidase MepM/ murein hydrolase activator NlpD